MKARTIRPGIQWVGAVDWDRRLFDELIPLPDGTSYNAYLIKGSEKTALIDTVDPSKWEILSKHLDDVPQLDYLIVQHVEQDHSGSIPDVVRRYPNIRLFASAKAKPMIVDHLGVEEERITVVEDRQTLSLGDRTLEFIYAPWVHWPETMLTYVQEDRVLCTCDFFGSHLATAELCSGADPHVCEAAKRYYAEIMMPFSRLIHGHLEVLSKIDIELIAPSHGPVYEDPAFILDAYAHWVNDPPHNLVLIPYTSMHGSTSIMVDRLLDALTERDVHVKSFNLTVTDLGAYAIHLVDAATVVFATPTMLVGPHPNVILAAYLTNALRPKLRYAGVVGSYGWGGRAGEQVQSLCSTLKVDWFDSVFVKGQPTQETLSQLDALADQIAAKHKTL